MTVLAQAKTRKQYQTSCIQRSRNIVVDLHATFLTVRLKGTRTSFMVAYDAIMDLGGKLADRARRAEKAKSR